MPGLVCLLAAAVLLLVGALSRAFVLVLFALVPLAAAAYLLGRAPGSKPVEEGRREEEDGLQPRTAAPTHQALLTEWLASAPERDEAEKALQAIGVVMTDQTRILAQELCIDRYEELLADRGIEAMRQAQQALLAACREVYPNALCGLTREDNVVAILFLESFLPLQEGNRASQAIRDRMESLFALSLTVGIGTYATTTAGIAESVRNAYFAMRYRMVFGFGQTIAYDHIQMRVGISPPYNREHEANIVDAYKRRDAVKLEMRLSEYYEAVCADSVNFVPVATMHLFMLLYMQMPRAQQEESDFVGTYSRLRSSTYYAQQMRILREYAVQNMAPEPNDSAATDAQTLERIEAFVRENIGNPDLGLVNISENTGLSKNTIRALLKEQRNTTPRDLIQDARMRRAMELLGTTAMTAKAIGEAVGYRESRYFYNVFKKYTGLTAYEYRSQSQGLSSTQPAP